MIEQEILNIKKLLSLQLINFERERIKMLKIAKRSKYIFAILLFISFIVAYFQTNSLIKDIKIAIIVYSVLLLLCIIMFILIKPYRLLSPKQFKSLKNNYKNEIIRSIIQNYNSEFQYYNIYKTHKKTLINSNLFGNKIDDQKEEDKIWGTINEHDFILSELHLRKGLKCTFQGVFIVVTLMIFKNEYLETQNSINKIIDNYKIRLKRNIQISTKKKKIYIAISNKTNLFEFDLHKSMFNNELLDNEIKIILELLNLIDQITKKYN